MATPGNERKLDFLQRVIRRPRADVVQIPVYVSRSLENIIAPRTYFMRARGRELSRTLSYLRETYPAFCKRCGCTEAEFGEWLTAWRQTPEGRLWGDKAATSAAAEPPAAMTPGWRPQRWLRAPLCFEKQGRAPTPNSSTPPPSLPRRYLKVG